MNQVYSKDYKVMKPLMHVDNSHLYNQNETALLRNKDTNLNGINDNNYAFVYNNNNVYRLPIHRSKEVKEGVFNNVVNEILSSQENDFRRQVNIEGAMKQLDSNRSNNKQFFGSRNFSQSQKWNKNPNKSERFKLTKYDNSNGNFYFINNNKKSKTSFLPEPSDIDNLENENENFENLNNRKQFDNKLIKLNNNDVSNMQIETEENLKIQDISADEIECFYNSIKRFDEHNVFD